MQVAMRNPQHFDTAVVDYINEIKAGFEKQFHELNVKNKELEDKNHELESNYKELDEKYKLLLFYRFSRSSEKYLQDKNQKWLFVEENGKNEIKTKEAETTEVKSHKRKKRGRKPLDPKLPRKEEYIDIPENEKICACGANLTRIGEETSEKLEIIPQQIFVRKTIRYKYACRCCEGTADEEEKAVKIAPVPPAIIPRSIASASLLSYIMVHKYQDHIPYYRQEYQFHRIGVEISRQDMSNWQQQVFNKLSPLFTLLKEILKSGPVLQMDETPVQVMGEQGREDTQKSYMWLTRGGPEDKKVIWYEYYTTRGAEYAKTFLEGFSGYLQTDGHNAYDNALIGRNDIKHAGCFAHSRRKFFEATKVTGGSPTAEEALGYIKRLYEIERKLREKNLSENVFLEKRKEEVEGVLAEFKIWLEKQLTEIPPSLQLGKAVTYTLNQWNKLVMYLQTPHLTPDNNACENAIRPFVLGRKNWLFNKCPEGAKSSCGIYTLIETAKQNNLEPLLYLRELFEKSPFVSSPEGWVKLLPWNIFTT